MDTSRFRATSLHFQHYASPDRIGISETTPRLSWKFENAPANFKQARYQLQIHAAPPSQSSPPDHDIVTESDQGVLVEWPLTNPLSSRARVFARVRCWSHQGDESDWGDYASVVCGLLERDLWTAKRIASPWDYPSTVTQPEELFAKEFVTSDQKNLAKARLYITAQGTYEARINATRVGDHLLAPGWTVYDRRLRYQTFDVLPLLSQTSVVLQRHRGQTGRGMVLRSTELGSRLSQIH
ncbi:hypothetical protein ACHAQH_007301 [Verticillium albo-atrum]